MTIKELMLSLNNVSVAYQKSEAVKDVTFELGVGQIGCLLGPSGCGKTSILRAVAGFEKVSEGQIFLRKKLVSALHSHLEPEKRRVAVVFQDYALFPHLTVAQNIAFGLHQQSNEKKRQRVTELLMLVGLPDMTIGILTLYQEASNSVLL